jgi:hypothetical protein
LVLPDPILGSQSNDHQRMQQLSRPKAQPVSAALENPAQDGDDIRIRAAIRSNGHGLDPQD